jgi:hypothetical protein
LPTADAETIALAGLRSEPSPIVEGHVHWNPYIRPADLDAGRWGEEFVPGVHVDLRQPSRLAGLCGACRAGAGSTEGTPHQN